ncbi:MAG: hypothetical protein HY875_01685 [Chloroflexi bacterium]|nr:hypothetical protein [Chloroflexota bacterium]
MDLARARFLVSARGREALAGLDAGLGTLPLHRLAAVLRESWAPDEAAALAEQVTLAARARERFGESPLPLYSANGLEMMTHPLVAQRRAGRLADNGLPVLDLTCGIGGDLHALAATGARGAGLDRDRPTALLAAANVPGAAVVQGEATRPPFDLSRHAVLIDPSRRAGVMRAFDPRAFTPPWDVTMTLAAAAAAGVVKGPPGIDRAHLPVAAEVEFVQLGRGLRECALWFGGDAVPGLRRAVLLPAGAELTSEAPEAPAAIVPPGPFLLDPESCVTRAGLVRHLAQRTGARMIDPEVAYLAAAEPAFDPLCATFEVLERLDFSVARLRGLLRARGWRPDEIRRRAFPVEPDELRRLLGDLPGERVTLLCTTLAGKRTVFVARRLWPPQVAPGETA